MEGSLELGLLLFGHHWFLLVLVAFVSVCASLYVSFIPCTASSSTQKTDAADSSQVYLSTNLHSITSQKTNLSISRSVHPCMGKVKIEALITTILESRWKLICHVDRDSPI